MTTRTVITREDAQEIARVIEGLPLPFKLTWTEGASRSLSQNALAHKWYAEIAKHLGDTTTETVRATCKLEIGVPIRRRDDDEWREWYDGAFRPLPYHMKLEFFERLDLPMTRDFTVPQMKEYMDAVQQRFRAAGVYLTDPELRGRT